MKKIILLFIIIITVISISKSQDKNTIVDTNKVSEKKFRLPDKPCKISINAGSAILILNGSKKDMNGFYFNVDFDVFLYDYFGIGIKYKQYRTKLQLMLLKDQFYYNDPEYPIPYIGENEITTFNYWGISLIYKKQIFRNFIGIASLSGGCNDFWNYESPSYSVVKSKNFALDTEFSLEYYFLKNFGIAANIGIFYTKLRNPKINPFQKTQIKVNILRFDFSLGLNFRFNPK